MTNPTTHDRAHDREHTPRRRLGRTLCALALGLGLAGAPAPSAAAQLVDPETWAQLLIDHPLERGGDIDKVLAGWLALLDEEPEHPLAEATLSLMGSRLGEVADPRALLEGLQALDPEWFEPAALRARQLLIGGLQARLAPADTLRHDQFPGWLAAWRVLGPLDPLADPDAHLADGAWLRDPTAVTSASGPAGAVAWRDATRPTIHPALHADRALWPDDGWWLAASSFELPEGGAGWLEFDVSARAGGSLPALWAWSLNGAEPVAEDETSGQRPSPRLVPVVFRAGVNRLVLRAHSDSGLRPAVRVLDADGWPWPGRADAPFDAALGERVRDDPPRAEPLSSERWLASRASLAPELLGLRGWLESVQGRPVQGLGWLDQAVQAAPGSVGLAALYARLLEQPRRALPDVWRRNRAQALAERVLEDDPQRLAPGLALADRLRAEDQTEQAIARYRALADAHPRDVQALLGLARAYRELGMSVFADRAVEQAAARAPVHPAVLDARAARLDAAGFDGQALELQLQRAGIVGRDPGLLRGLARKAQGLGDVRRAEALLVEASAREGRPEFEPVRARFLAELGRYDEADALLAELSAAAPRWSSVPMQRADLALRRGDEDALRRQLDVAAALSPGWRVVRDRLAELGVPDRAREFFEQHDVPLETVQAELVEWSDSVVRLLDSSYVYVFDNGVLEIYTHDVYQPLDLEGCDRLGSQRLGGDVLLVRVIKADTGAVLETPRVDGEYVLPELRPGDLVETATRRIANAPGDGLLDLGRWTFESLEMPFARSRYVVSLPDALGLRLTTRRFDGSHEVVADGGRTTHVFETRDRDRVLPEPGMPPAEWFLPWVHLYTPRDAAVARRQYVHATTPMLGGSPWVAAAVERATAGLSDEESKARALHQLVNDTLDQRSWWNAPATHALLGREGHPVWLYAGLLAEAGIAHEVVWSRGTSPDADPSPDPVFPEPGRWAGELLVRVEPRGAEPAWCDMATRTLPYGRLVHDAPGAQAVSGATGELLTLPEVPADERAPGMQLELEMQLAVDGSAELKADAGLLGGLGLVIKEQLQEIPETFLGMGVTGVAAQVLPGVTVRQWEFAGLDDDGDVTAHVAGDIGTYLDRDGETLVAPLPFPTLDLSNTFGGEGERRLPFWHSESVVMRMSARLELPEGLQLVGHAEPLELEFAGARYALSVEPDGERAYLLRRELVAPPFVLQPEEFGAFREACARIDEAERGRLRFRLVE